MPLKINDTAPNFTLDSTTGKKFTLNKNQKDKACIIYFYPKDFTSVCTQEACSFRDEFSVFKDLDIEVIGISKDSIETHLKFQKENRLPFELLSDPSGSVIRRYKAMLPIIGVPRRVTYLLNKKHKIAAVLEDMFHADEHIKTMIEQVKSGDL